jgi:hypothetical protein
LADDGNVAALLLPRAAYEAAADHPHVDALGGSPAHYALRAMDGTPVTDGREWGLVAELLLRQLLATCGHLQAPLLLLGECLEMSPRFWYFIT